MNCCHARDSELVFSYCQLCSISWDCHPQTFSSTICVHPFLSAFICVFRSARALCWRLKSKRPSIPDVIRPGLTLDCWRILAIFPQRLSLPPFCAAFERGSLHVRKADRPDSLQERADEHSPLPGIGVRRRR